MAPTLYTIENKFKKYLRTSKIANEVRWSSNQAF